MLTLTIARTTELTSSSYVDPFVRSFLFSWTTAAWWSTIGGTGGPEAEDPTILDVLVNSVKYLQADDLATCTSTEATWFYDTTGKQLYIHFQHSIVPEDVLVQYGRGIGYSDDDVVYIDNTEYLPLLAEVPIIDNVQDIRQYDQLAFLVANVSLSNQGGVLDALLAEPVIGNTAILAYLPESAVIDGKASSNDVQILGTFFVESLSASPQGINIALQDTRKISVQVPTATVNTTDYPNLDPNDAGTIIPLVYGSQRAIPGVKVDALATGTTDATYRVAELLTVLSSVQVKIDDTWEARTPSSTDLANGTFTIPNARAAVNKTPYDVRLWTCTNDFSGTPSQLNITTSTNGMRKRQRCRPVACIWTQRRTYLKPLPGFKTAFSPASDLISILRESAPL